MPTDPRHGTRFAVYLCPPAESEYYRLGSEVLGYDVRAGKELPLPADVRPEWQTASGPYGFHLTLLEGFWCAPETLPEIEAELRACVACLSPTADLSLHNGTVVRATTHGDRGIGQIFNPSPDLLMFHAFLLARLARFVTHSPFFDRLVANPDRYPEAYQKARLALLKTPRGLDTYEPHYTLVDPFGGSEEEGEALRQRLEILMAPWAEQTYNSVALFVKPEGELRWQVRADVTVSGLNTAAPVAAPV